MKRLLVFGTLALLIFSQSAFGLETGGIDFSIRYYEKRIYYVGDPDHPVELEVVITNNSSETYRFKMSDTRVFSLDFEVTTPTNLRLEPAPRFIRERNTNRPVLYREISLAPSEKYGIIVSLQDYVEIDEPGLYTVRGLFYPELNRHGDGQALSSNTLSLSMRPAIVFPEERAMLEAETGKLLQRQPIPPDEVVHYTLTARQRSQWEKFFLYMDLESLYRSYPPRDESFRNMSEEQQRAAVARFKEGLTAGTVDEDIQVIPTSFEILETSYTPFEGTVVVVERFQQEGYTEIKRYTYYLERRDDIWLITDYETFNLGTE
ncbi:MAG: hypothetical protein JW820_19450 [Spirochaetales bacterium]|nr:hypothetical protein [Spirochaetales bacterium]